MRPNTKSPQAKRPHSARPKYEPGKASSPKSLAKAPARSRTQEAPKSSTSRPLIARQKSATGSRQTSLASHVSLAISEASAALLQANTAAKSPVKRKESLSGEKKKGASRSSSKQSLSRSGSLSPRLLERREEAIRVSVRLRPLMDTELRSGHHYIWRVSDGQLWVEGGTPDIPKSVSDRVKGVQFGFDHTFEGDAATSDVYKKVAKGIVHDAIRGINGCVLAYGQTGAGKTYSMSGDASHPGIISWAVHDVFNKEFLLRMTYLEIYMERVHDLLQDGQAGEDSPLENLLVKEDPSKGFYVAGLAERLVSSEGEVYEWLSRGERKRHFARTDFNEVSSRSHVVFTLIIENSQSSAEDDDVKTTRIGRLHMVDLAGSEPFGAAISEKAQAESKLINKSLFFLSEVISKLSARAEASGKDLADSFHIPFRESKLTRILASALGGHSRSALLVALHPSHCFLDESLKSLRFADKAKKIKSRLQANYVSYEQSVIAQQKLTIAKLREELRLLQKSLQSVPRSTSLDEGDESSRLNTKVELEYLQSQMEAKLERMSRFIVGPDIRHERRRALDLSQATIHSGMGVRNSIIVDPTVDGLFRRASQFTRSPLTAEGVPEAHATAIRLLTTMNQRSSSFVESQKERFPSPPGILVEEHSSPLRANEASEDTEVMAMNTENAHQQIQDELLQTHQPAVSHRPEAETAQGHRPSITFADAEGPADFLSSHSSRRAMFSDRLYKRLRTRPKKRLFRMLIQPAARPEAPPPADDPAILRAPLIPRPPYPAGPPPPLPSLPAPHEVWGRGEGAPVRMGDGSGRKRVADGDGGYEAETNDAEASQWRKELRKLRKEQKATLELFRQFGTATREQMQELQGAIISIKERIDTRQPDRTQEEPTAARRHEDQVLQPCPSMPAMRTVQETPADLKQESVSVWGPVVRAVSHEGATVVLGRLRPLACRPRQCAPVQRCQMPSVDDVLCRRSDTIDSDPPSIPEESAAHPLTTSPPMRVALFHDTASQPSTIQTHRNKRITAEVK
ncbi:unnamed protein product [Vitrella brassicaformis CCMP3155]|uniref:Kinesin motor domain-containing protein n=2 Tax=Vitrella brassicaformis TaxID=1169539 RepID=A0A0G4GV16_VITBC|nr:unnamed protein product [Vitrella brassicaformis CCMP3155]|eukprot:CEM34738.1 unnamed protein product [Vitrella brassicaformis CCMP3155]